MSIQEYIKRHKRLHIYPYHLLYAIMCDLIEIGAIDNVG